MSFRTWIFLGPSLGVMILLNAWTALGDTVTLQDGKQVQGKLRLEGALGVPAGSDLSSLSLARVKQTHLSGTRLLFLMEDESWLECQLLSPDLVLEKDGLWQIVRVDTVARIQLEAEAGPEASVVLQHAETVPAGRLAAPPPSLPVEGSLPELGPGEGPETLSLDTVPVRPLQGKAPAPERKRAWISPEGGYTLLLGNDRDVLKDAPGYGVSFGYELFQSSPWFVGPEISFLRTPHQERGSFGDGTQYTNPLGLGIRGGVAFGRVDCYAKLQLGPVFLDASRGSTGKNDTFFGVQGGLGADYRITPWLAAGPEVRLTEAAGRTSWISLLAKVTARF